MTAAASYEKERAQFEDTLFGAKTDLDDDHNLLRRFSASLSANTLLSEDADIAGLDMPWLPRGVQSGNLGSNLEV